jgi:Dullard-like phosphatase family protein
MQNNKIQFKTIEDIAIQYIINTTESDNDFEDTINTVKDPKISIKGCSSVGGSFYCRSNKFIENGNYIFFRKIPQKTLSEDELVPFTTETDDSSPRNTIYNSSTVIKLSHTKIFVKNSQNLKYSKKLYFPLKYYLVYDCLSELYLPLKTSLEDLNNLRNNLIDTKKKIEYFILHESIHEKNNDLIENIFTGPQISKKLDEFLEEEKCCEIIEFGLILFIVHLMFGVKIQYTELINDEDIEILYGEICFVLHKMIENIMLKLLFNENYNKNNSKNDKKENKKNSSNSISFESICSRYVKDYFKGGEKSQNKIINDLNTNLGIIFQRLYNAINILLINFTKAKIYSNSIDNPDEIETYFLGLLDYNFPQNDNGEDEIFVNENDIGNNIKNDDKMDESDNNKNENEKEVLQKEFNDQYACFKMMFYFLTQKELKENTINENLINIDNDDNNINNIENKDNIYLNQKEKSPYKNTTFTSSTSNNKIIESENNIKNKESKGEFTKKIKNNLTNPQCSEKLKEGNNSSFYPILKNYLDLYFNNFTQILEKNLVKPPFLPELDTKRYKYTLVLDLDETLVHYMEEENSAYVQVRPYADYFLKELSKFFEIVLFTAAEEDYTDIVLKELNKNNYITHILCRKYTELNNGSYLKDLSKLGRDLSKVVIVDNNKDNFRLQPENGLFISSYFGEQNDNELYLLCGDLMKIIEIQPEDIRPVIKEIDAVMQNRYAENMYVLQ